MPRNQNSSFARGRSRSRAPEICIDRENFYFAYNSKGERNSRIIQLEPDDFNKCRVFTLNQDKKWKCLKCRRQAVLEENKEKLWVPQHGLCGGDPCPVLEYEDVHAEHASYGEKSNSCSYPMTPAYQNEDIYNEAESDEDDDNAIILWHPSSGFLKEKCQLLGIPYSKEAYLLGSKMDDSMKDDDIPDKVLEGDFNDFECVSKLFSGDEKHHHQVQLSLLEYMFSNYQTMGTFQNINFKTKSVEQIKEILFARRMTRYHWHLLATWFSCRIKLFENNVWKIYGNWDNIEDEIPTFLLKREPRYGGKPYNIVLTLK